MKKLSVIIALFSVITAVAQQKIDGIAAVINKEIVIKSELQEQFQEMKSRGMSVSSECDVLESVLGQKVLLAAAKQDTLITVDSRSIGMGASEQVKRMQEYYKDDDIILKQYGFASMEELRQEIIKNQEETSYIQQFSGKITKGIDASPVEVNDFYKAHKDEMPNLQEQVVFSQIVFKPELSEAHKKEVVDKLNEYRTKILSGEATFADMAKSYSEDKGSAVDGGLITDMKRGMMVKDFEGVSYNLKEGEISEPFETEYGFHIVKLEKRKGSLLDVRHILILNKPNEDEIKTSKELAKSVKEKLDKGEITFENAVKEYSKDKTTRMNKGVYLNPETGEREVTRADLPSTLFLEITGLKKEETSQPFEDKEAGNKVYKIIRLDEVIAAHKMTIETDYERIKEAAIKEKKSIATEKWIKTHLNDYYIKISDDYKQCPFKQNWLRK